uniref:Elongator complex protein 5 n=1 Tax=Rhodosorus marinus TaxID=101924 RepID=A0A7S3EB07_9RHOD|mmetsp:Transcript_19214/g.76969  ORF Transcript_19214/g.76969 Transcript_19214/m.76969 type:complete len:285 (+) Transcript_19214:1061-1915(+)
MNDEIESCFSKIGLAPFIAIDVCPESLQGNSGKDDRKQLTFLGADLCYKLLAAATNATGWTGTTKVVAFDTEPGALAGLLNRGNRVDEFRCTSSKSLEDLRAFLRESQPCLVAIDSLSSFLRRWNVRTFAEILMENRILRGFKGIVALWRSSTHERNVRAGIESVATALICARLRSPKMVSDYSVVVTSGDDVVLEIVRKKPSGRISSSQFLAKLVEDSIHSEPVPEEEDVQAEVEEKDALADLNVPFNINLTEKERGERSQVCLIHKTTNPSTASFQRPDKWL